MFNKNKIRNDKSLDFKLFKYLYDKNKDNFVGERYKVTENKKLIKLNPKLIYTKFQVNSRYTLKEIKLVLQDIYENLGITSKPKATDLGKYFNISEVKILNNAGKRDKGYEILGIL